MNTREYKPTLAQLRTFVTVADSKHFGTAAQKLNISQPSLSQALVALETGLNLKLIERSTRRVIVTASGEALLPFAKATLEAADAFVAQSRRAFGLLSGPLSGPLTVGIIPTLAPYILPDFLKLAGSIYPDLKPSIVEDQSDVLFEQLRDGHIDAAILTLPTGSTGMTVLQLFSENFILVTPKDHPLAGRRNVALDVLAELELILLDQGHFLRDQISGGGLATGVNSSVASETMARASSLTTIIQLVAAGLGSTLVPESALATECARPDLGLATFDATVVTERTIGLVSRASSAGLAELHGLGKLITQAHSNAVNMSKELLNS